MYDTPLLWETRYARDRDLRSDIARLATSIRRMQTEHYHEMDNLWEFGAPLSSIRTCQARQYGEMVRLWSELEGKRMELQRRIDARSVGASTHVLSLREHHLPEMRMHV